MYVTFLLRAYYERMIKVKLFSLRKPLKMNDICHIQLRAE